MHLIGSSSTIYVYYNVIISRLCEQIIYELKYASVLIILKKINFVLTHHN